MVGIFESDRGCYRPHRQGSFSEKSFRDPGPFAGDVLLCGQAKKSAKEPVNGCRAIRRLGQIFKGQAVGNWVLIYADTTLAILAMEKSSVRTRRILSRRRLFIWNSRAVLVRK
jgi:hypothetical protein